MVVRHQLPISSKYRHTQTEALARGRTGCELRPTMPVHKLRPWKQTGKVVDSTCTQTEALLRGRLSLRKIDYFLTPPLDYRLLFNPISSVPHRPSFIPPSWRGPLGSRRPKKAIAFSGGCFLVGAPFGPRGSVAWVPALGLSAVVGSCLLRTYHTSTTTQQHNPYSQLRIRHQPDLAYSTLQLFFPSHPPYNSNYITDTRGLVPERA